MNFNQFVVRNTMRNKHLYLAYFLSTMFSVMVFFAFTTFTYHPALSTGMAAKAQMGMIAAAIIIYGFSFLFVLYSMDVFIQSRKKEFGLLMIQGMSPKQLKKMIFIENLVIGFFATVIGSIIGIGFSQMIIWFSNLVMHLNLAFYLPLMPFIITILAFAVLFLVISFFIQFRLPKATLQELLKAGEMGKGVIRGSKIRGILAILLLAAGYTIALNVREKAVLAAVLPVMFLVIVGTKYLFDQLSISIIEAIKKKPAIFWKKTNMVVFSDLAFRMKDNARSFFLVSIISTVAFAAIGTLYGFSNLIFRTTDSMPFEYTLSASDQPENAAVKAKLIAELKAKNIQFDEVNYVLYTNEEGISLIKESAYNQLANAADKPTLQVGNNGVLVKSTSLVSDEASSSQPMKTVKLSGNQELSVTKTEETKFLLFYGPLVVVPDKVNLTGLSTDAVAIWQPKNASRAQLLAIGKDLSEKYPTLQAKTYISQSTTDMYSPILFVGIFIGIVFFVSAGSFLYFRLYSDMETDVEKFRMIHKLGLTKKELKKMIYQQVGILFFSPIIVSLIHGAVALTAMYALFSMTMQLAGWQVLGVFALIQIVYYLIARTFYFRKVYHLVTQ